MGTLTFLSAPVLQMQAYNVGAQRGRGQMIAVGSKLYFVIQAQVGVAPSNAIQVYESTDILTWSLVATYGGLAGYLTDSSPSNIPLAVIGSVIYMMGRATSNVTPANTYLLIHRFDTSSNSFLSDSSLGPLQTGPGETINQLQSISAFNNGTLLVTSTNVLAGGTPTTEPFQIQLYTPGSDTWGAATTVSADSSVVIQQTHDSTSDLAFVFYQKAATQELRCLTVQSSLAFTDTTVVTFVAGRHPTGAQLVGIPSVTTNTNEIVIPYQYFPVSGPPVLKAARATIGGAPTFTNDLVEDISTLPVNSQVQAFDQLQTPGWIATDIGGVLYVFYDIDNGGLDSGASVASLYYRFSTAPGVWSAPEIAFTSPISNEQGVPYAAQVPLSNPVILVAAFNPTTWPALASLSNYILYLGAAPVVSSIAPILGGGSSGKFRCCPPEKASQLMQAAELVRQKLRGAECWPWEHLIPPPNSDPINLLADLASPAPVPGVKVPVLTYQVPSGMTLYILGVLQDVIGSGFSPGDALWTIDENTAAQNSGVNGFVSLPVPLGSLDAGRWWVLRRSLKFEQLTLVRSTVINVNLGTGLPVAFVSGFLGYLVPAQ